MEMEDIANYMATKLQFQEWIAMYEVDEQPEPPTYDVIHYDEAIALHDPAFHQFYDLLPVENRPNALRLYFEAQTKQRIESDAMDNAATHPGNWRVLLRTLRTSNVCVPTSQELIHDDDSCREGIVLPAPLPLIRQILRETRYAPWGDTIRCFLILRYGNVHTSSLLREELAHARSSVILYRLLDVADECVNAPTSVVDAVLHPQHKHRPLQETPDLQTVVEPLCRYMPLALRQEIATVDAALHILSIALGRTPTAEWQAQTPTTLWRLRPDSSVALMKFRVRQHHPDPRTLTNLFLREI